MGKNINLTSSAPDGGLSVARDLSHHALSLILVFTALSGSFISGCDDETTPLREMMVRNRDQDIKPQDDLGISPDQGDLNDLSVMPPDLGELDLGDPRDASLCMERGECTSDGLWRRCEGGEVIESVCPEGSSCEPTLGRCVEEEACQEGVNVCSGVTGVIICQDGEYQEPIPCEEGTQCIAGRCLSACERASATADYQGCEFWAVDLDNILDGSGEGPGASPSAIVLSHLGSRSAEVTISDAEGVVAHQATLMPGETQSFPLPRSDQVGTQLNAASWRAVTSEPVLAYQLSPLQREGTSSVDATLLIPSAGLDDSYRVLTWPGQGYNQRGFFSVVATGDAPTTVSIIPSGEVSVGVDFRGELSSPQLGVIAPFTGEIWTETLTRGEVFHVQSGPFSDLSGTLIVADQDVAVFAGTRCSNIPAGIPRCDHLEHQMLPLRNQGSRYVAPGGLPRSEELTYYRVVAVFDQTTVTLTPSLNEPPITLNAGEVTSFSSSSPLLIESNAPVMVGMFLASADAGALGVGDPSFVLLPPVEQLRDEYAFLTPYDFERDGLTLFARGEAQVTLDADPLEVVWTQVSNTDWWVAHLEVEDGPHRVSADRPFGVIASGYDEEVSYAFTGGMRLEKLREAEPPPLAEVCLGGGALNTPCESGESGVCASGRLTCMSGEESSCLPIITPSEERCNQRDDDCDGLVDEATCAQFGLSRTLPSEDRLTGVEQTPLSFSVTPTGDALGRDIEWFVDGERFVGERGTTLVWTPLNFEEGARVVTARVTDDERVAEMDWLVLINDAPSNTAAIWGRVTMPTGEVVPGVSLELAGGVSESVHSTDPRGYYSLPAEPGEYALKIDSVFKSAPLGFPRGILTLSEGIDIELINQRRDLVLPIARVSGVVATESQERLADTRLEFDGDCFGCRNALQTDANGSYETLLYHGEWSVESTPPAVYQLPTRVIEGEQVIADRRWDIIFPAVYQVDLLVVDQYDDPTAGVTILFESEDAEIAIQSDSNGMISTRLPRGAYRVILDTVSHPRPTQIGIGRVTLNDALSVEGDLGPITLPLPNAWVSGIITGAGDGSPQAQVSLQFSGDCFACRGTAVSDAQGQYGLPLLHSDYEVEITPPAESDYVNQTGADIPVFADLDNPVTLEGPAYVLTGTLSDPLGDAVSGVTIKSVEGRTETSSLTDAEGRFTLRLLSDTYTLKIDTVFGPRPAEAPRGVVPIWSGVINEDQALALTAPYSYISGRVQEAAGDVIPNVELNFDGDCFACTQTAQSGPTGEYEAIVFQGVYTVDVTPPIPYSPVSIEQVDCSAVTTSLDIDY